MHARWIGDTARFDNHEVVITATEPLTRSGDALACLGLLPAMHDGGTLDVDAAVSPQLLGSLDTIQGTVIGWGAASQRISVRATETTSQPRAAGVGCCFSGGLDSWYSVLSNRHRITHLVTAIGFDMPVGSDLARLTVARLRDAASRLDLPLVVITFDGLRAWSDPRAPWPWYHGGALAAMGHLLVDQIGTLIVPATHTTTDQMPWGSHPDLDPLWSSERLTIEHHGDDAGRVRKAGVVADSGAALSSLRVCWLNPGGSYNCGHCEKCLRTMVNLRAVGALERCTTFDRPLSLRRLAWTTYHDENTRAFVAENLAAVRARGGDPELERALQAMLDGRYYRGPLRLARNVSRRIKALLRGA